MSADETKGRVEERGGCRIEYFADGLGYVVTRIAPIVWSDTSDPNEWVVPSHMRWKAYGSYLKIE